jgi:long-chain acyl-CoA synthetase
VFDTEIRIVDPAGDDLTPLPAGESGEVLIRGPQV